MQGQVSIFKDLLEEQKVMLLNVLKIENFEKGAEVFRQGDEADALYAVNKGQLEVIFFPPPIARGCPLPREAILIFKRHDGENREE